MTTNFDKIFLAVFCASFVNTQIYSQACWWTGCQPDDWAVRGCDQYNLSEWNSTFCVADNGNDGLKFKCCPLNKTRRESKALPNKELPPKESRGTSESPWIYVGIGTGIILLICILICGIFLFRRLNQINRALSKAEVREFIHGAQPNEYVNENKQDVVESITSCPYDKSYEICRKMLKIQNDDLLGTGQFGCVVKAAIEKEENVLEVALKMAKRDCPKTALKGLLSEIKILIYLGMHENIVSIIGAYTAELETGIVYIATELCAMGSLESYLRKFENFEKPKLCEITMDGDVNEETTVSGMGSRDMLKWSYEICCGMEYLGIKHVVHADLATRNVLLTSTKTAKITDFGLSRKLYEYTNYVKKQQEPLPWRWMSVESLKRLEFSEKSDVWSFGVTLWEIFSMGDIPYPGLSWNLEFVDCLVNGLRLQSPPYASTEIYAVMAECWNLKANERPTFANLKLQIKEIFNSNDSE